MSYYTSNLIKGNINCSKPTRNKSSYLGKETYKALTRLDCLSSKALSKPCTY